MKNLTIFLFSIFLSVHLFGQDYIRPFYFDEGSFELKGYYNSVLDDLSEKIKSGGYAVRIEGHTNNYGDAGTNMKLSERRSEGVVEYLKTKGITEDNIKVTNFGETLPTYDNNWALGRKLNRRVDLIIEGMGEFSDFKEKKTISDLYIEISEKPEKFCFLNERDTTFITKNKTLIYIPKDAFRVNGFKEGSCIDVYVEEFHSRDEMLMRGLSTTSDMYPMISAGMMNLYAKYDGVLLEMNQDRSYTVVRKDIQAFDEALGVYEGNWTSDHINWDIPQEEGTVANNGIQRFNGGIMVDRDVFNDDLLDKPCKFFFCKVGRFFMSKKKKTEMEEFISAVADSVSEINALINSRNDLMTKYEVADQAQLKQAMEKAYEENGTLNMADMEFYMYSLNNPGWSNLDWMMKIPENDFRELTVDLPANTNTDCKLIFEDYNTILPATPGKKNFRFEKVPNGYNAKLVVIRMIDDKVKMAILGISGQENVSELDFKTYTIAELKNALANIR